MRGFNSQVLPEDVPVLLAVPRAIECVRLLGPGLQTVKFLVYTVEGIAALVLGLGNTNIKGIAVGGQRGGDSSRLAAFLSLLYGRFSPALTRALFRRRAYDLVYAFG